MVESINIKKNLGKNIQRLRLLKGLSQEKLAELVGLERETISSIEVGRAFTSSEVLAKFSNLFNVEPSYLLKPNFLEESANDNNLRKEINHLLSTADTKKLKTIYNIIIALDG